MREERRRDEESQHKSRKTNILMMKSIVGMTMMIVMILQSIPLMTMMKISMKKVRILNSDFFLKKVLTFIKKSLSISLQIKGLLT